MRNKRLVVSGLILIIIYIVSAGLGVMVTLIGAVIYLLLKKFGHTE